MQTDYIERCRALLMEMRPVAGAWRVTLPKPATEAERAAAESMVRATELALGVKIDVSLE